MIEDVLSEIIPTDVQKPSNQQTARQALKVLRSHEKYRTSLVTDFSSDFRNRLAAAYALRGKIIYGKAFDAVLFKDAIDLKSISVDQLRQRLDDIILCEIKSTSRNLKSFNNYFFSISTAEVLVAQSLGDNFKFIFVNTRTSEVGELSLQQVYKHARAIYPTWSITLNSLEEI